MTAVLVWSVLSLAVLGHGFVWSGIVNRLHSGVAAPRWLAKLLTVICGVLFVAFPAAILWRERGATGSPFNVLAEGGWMAAYLWFCAVVGAGSLIVKPWIESRRYDRTVLRQWTADRLDVRKAIGCKPLYGASAKLLGNLPGNEVLSVSIDRKRLVIPRLPRELEGLTIAHLSDLHMIGGIGREYFCYVVRQVNNLRPDVIAISGDIIENAECLSWLEASLGQLCAPLGVYFILGNHDLLIDAAGTRKTLIDAGLTYLGGRWLRAEWNGVTVAIGGNERPWLPSAELNEAVGHAAPADFRILLSHSPDQFGWGQRADVDVILAGHTHGGQVQLPLLGVIMSPSLHGTRYACGVFRRGSTVMHVTRGVGGETPLRWRCPPEIALLEFTREIG